MTYGEGQISGMPLGGRPLAISRLPVGKAAGASAVVLGMALAAWLALPLLRPVASSGQAELKPHSEARPNLVFPFVFAHLPLHQRSAFGPVLVSLRPPGTPPFVEAEGEETPLPVLPSQSIGLIEIPLPAPRPLALREPDAFPPLPPLRPAALPPASGNDLAAAPAGEVPPAQQPQLAPVETTPQTPAAVPPPQAASSGPPISPALQKLATKQAEDKSFFDRLFGREQSKLTSLAYAPETEDTTRQRVAVLTRRYDRYTAVYDITARVLYMPDGRRIEAHSGLGERLDDIRYVYERNHGPTPPHLYDLSQRAQPFHGITALRMTPVGKGEVYGRNGLLAHPFMMGPNGDSNGCVSIKDYAAFLQAYRTGEVKRIAVVASLD